MINNLGVAQDDDEEPDPFYTKKGIRKRTVEAMSKMGRPNISGKASLKPRKERGRSPRKEREKSRARRKRAPERDTRESSREKELKRRRKEKKSREEYAE